LFENGKLKKKKEGCFLYDQAFMRDLKNMFKNISFESRKKCSTLAANFSTASKTAC